MLSFGGFIPQTILLENVNKSSHAPILIIDFPRDKSLESGSDSTAGSEYRPWH